MAQPKVVVLTASPDKAADYARILGRYGVRPAFVPPEPDLDAQAQALLAMGTQHVLREQSTLTNTAGVLLEGLGRACAAINHSQLVAWSVQGILQDSAEVSGYIDPSRGLEEGHGSWFGWDNVFVQVSTGLSYRQAAELGLKTSARDATLGTFIEARLRYADQVDLEHSPVHPEMSVDFSPGAPSVGGLLRASPLVEAAIDGGKGGVLDRLLGSVLADGLFLRSASSRRDRNYWMPGLNGGVPLTPKRDSVHELTFMMHDIMHSASPDLVFDGIDTPDARTTYILHRMIGEAASMVAADYLFADRLRRGGVDYDYSRRRIHPLFAGADPGGRAHHDPQAFKALVRANVDLALLGDPGRLAAMGATHAQLDAYREKYERYFVEDYRWTARNYDAVCAADAHTALMRRWSQHVGADLQRLGLQTVGGFVQAWGLQGVSHLPIAQAVDLVFEASWSQFFAPRIEGGTGPGLLDVDLERATIPAFQRYMLGQSGLCWRYGHVAGMDGLGQTIVAALAGLADHKDIEDVRGLYDTAVVCLLDAGAISHEDARVFRDVSPLFEPFYVFYESRTAPIATIEQALDAVFPSAPRPANERVASDRVHSDSTLPGGPA